MKTSLKQRTYKKRLTLSILLSLLLVIVIVVSGYAAETYTEMISNLSKAQLELQKKGQKNFEIIYPIKKTLTVEDSFGTLLFNSSCVACHPGGGRGNPVLGNMLVKLTSPTLDSQNNKDSANKNEKSKAALNIEWIEEKGAYTDGSEYSLRQPKLTITLPDGQPLPHDALVSARLPTSVYGLGFLEAIPESTILSLADPDDLNQDGISGKANQVTDLQNKKKVLGRFSLKANQPNLLQQNAAAYKNAMGLTNPLFPSKDGSTEINQASLEAMTLYIQTIAVPTQRLSYDLDVKQGKKLFKGANCTACHIAQLNTGDYPIAAIANQTIHPYTDLLLHDLGEGLADHRPEFLANGNEWKTSPLWGIGKSKAVSPDATYLHDGRARTLEEAILWHDGEAAKSKEVFKQMSKNERQILQKFLNSL